MSNERVFPLRNGGELIETEERILFSRSSPGATPLLTDGNAEIDDILDTLAWRQAQVESLRAELRGIGAEQYYALQAKCREQDTEIERLKDASNTFYLIADQFRQILHAPTVDNEGVEFGRRSIESLRTELAKEKQRSRELDEECEQIGRDKVRIADERAALVPRLKQAERERDEARQGRKEMSEFYDAAVKVIEQMKKNEVLQNENYSDMVKEAARLQQANAALLEGLRFYGEPRNQFPRRVVVPDDACPVEKDGGQRARNLLAQYDTAKSSDQEGQNNANREN